MEKLLNIIFRQMSKKNETEVFWREKMSQSHCDITDKEDLAQTDRRPIEIYLEAVQVINNRHVCDNVTLKHSPALIFPPFVFWQKCHKQLFVWCWHSFTQQTPSIMKCIFFIAALFVCGAYAFGDTFTVNCQPLTIQRSDPIVSPGAPSAHLHSVIGESNVIFL